MIKLRRRQISQEMKGISLLANSFKYFLGHAFIINYGGCYRLLVIHNWSLTTDRWYKTLRGARMAFLRLYQDRRWQKEDSPEWTSFYSPMLGSYPFSRPELRWM